jgi:dienelactone hydrolase
LLAPAAAQAKPTLLLFHGGGFIWGEPSIPDAEAAARAHGLKPIEVDYTLGDLDAALRDAERATERQGRIVAYGESAGAALAMRMAQRGLVEAAVGWLAPTDLRRLTPTGQEIIDQLGASQRQLRRASPGLHRTRNPVLAQIGDRDVLIPPRQSIRWARRDPRVKAQMVVGTHYLPNTAAERHAQLRTAMRFLARELGRTIPSSDPPPLSVTATGWGAP